MKKEMTDAESREFWDKLRRRKERPTLPGYIRKDDALRHSVQIRLTEEDWEWLATYTNEKKISVGALFRKLLAEFKAGE